MTDEKENKYGASTRVPSWVLDELEEIIKGHPRGSRPTRGELLEAAWRVYRESKGVEGERSSDVVPPHLRREVAKFIKIMTSGDVTAIKAVVANVDFFLDRLRPANDHK